MNKVEYGNWFYIVDNGEIFIPLYQVAKEIVDKGSNSLSFIKRIISINYEEITIKQECNAKFIKLKDFEDFINKLEDEISSKYKYKESEIYNCKFVKQKANEFINFIYDTEKLHRNYIKNFELYKLISELDKNDDCDFINHIHLLIKDRVNFRNKTKEKSQEIEEFKNKIRNLI